LKPAGSFKWLLIRGSLYSQLAEISGGLAWFFLTPLILHRLGPTQFAIWALSTSILTYGGLLDLGISGALVKYVAEFTATGDWRQAETFLATGLRLYFMLGLAGAAICCLSAPAFPDLFNVPPTNAGEATACVVLIGLTIGVLLPSSAAAAALRGVHRYDVVGLIQASTILLQTLAAVAVLLLGAGLIGLVAINLPVTILAGVLSALALRRFAPELRLGWTGARRQNARKILGFSSSLVVTQAAAQLEWKTDELVISSALPIGALAPYAVAQKLAAAVLVIGAQLVKMLLPLASALSVTNERLRLRAVYLTSSRIALGSSLAAGSSLVLLGRPLLAVWAGPEYAASSNLLAALVVAAIITVSQWPGVLILQGMARHRPLAVMAISSGVANLVLSLVLVRTSGTLGVAIATLMPTALVSLGWMLPHTLRTLAVPGREWLVRVAVPGTLPAVAAIGVLLAVRGMVHSPVSILGAGLLAGATFCVAYMANPLAGDERQTACEAFHWLAGRVSWDPRVRLS
jgi:O-antigen/teichoic acid export membrane protein